MIPLRAAWESPGRGGLRRQAGATAVELALGLGVLLLPAALLVASLPGWIEGQQAARLAARRAARTVAVGGPDAAQRAVAVATTVMANRGVVLEQVRITGDTGGEGTSGAPGRQPRQGAVTAAVTVRLPALTVPLAGPVAGLAWTATHTAPLDVYRSRR